MNTVVEKLLLFTSEHISDVVEAQVDLFAHLLAALLVEPLPFVQLLELELCLLYFTSVKGHQLSANHLQSLLPIVHFVLLA